MEHRGNRVPGVGERVRRVEERHCLLPCLERGSETEI